MHLDDTEHVAERGDTTLIGEVDDTDSDEVIGVFITLLLFLPLLRLVLSLLPLLLLFLSLLFILGDANTEDDAVTSASGDGGRVFPRDAIPPMHS
jgi:hypothetical protein